MLFAKINPKAKFVNQSSPFSVLTKECDLMTAIARPYVLGAKEVRFQVIYGSGTIEGQLVNEFESFLESEVILNQEEISNWGTDDSLILNTIAQKVGTSIEGFYNSADVTSSSQNS